MGWVVFTSKISGCMWPMTGLAPASRIRWGTLDGPGPNMCRWGTVSGRSSRCGDGTVRDDIFPAARVAEKWSWLWQCRACRGEVDHPSWLLQWALWLRRGHNTLCKHSPPLTQSGRLFRLMLIIDCRVSGATGQLFTWLNWSVFLEANYLSGLDVDISNYLQGQRL